MPINRSTLHGIDNAVNGDLVIDQIGKGSCSSSTITEFEVSNMTRIKAKLLESIVSKISANYFFWVDIVNRPGSIENCSAFSDNRRLAHAKRTGKNPCCHSQGCQNPAHFQLFGFGAGLFASPFIAVISVCHMQIPLSVEPFLSVHPSIYLLKRSRQGEVYPGAVNLILVKVLFEGEPYGQGAV